MLFIQDFLIITIAHVGNLHTSLLLGLFEIQKIQKTLINHQVMITSKLQKHLLAGIYKKPYIMQ